MRRSFESSFRTNMPKASRRKKASKRRKTTKRRKRSQKGGGALSVVAGLPKAAWGITKGIESLRAKQEAKHTKKMLERMRRGEKWNSGGESFRCSVM